MAPDKRYTEEEARAIFERATERHEEARHAEEASRAGLTLEELQRIGAEAGIDPDHVAAAAIANASTPTAPEELETFLGIPTVLHTSRSIPVTISDEAWEKVVPELRRLFGKDGNPGQFGRVRTWQIPYDYFTAFAPVNVMLSPEKDGTRVEIEKDQKYNVYSLLAIAAFILFFGVMGATAGLAQGAATGLAGLFAWLFAALPGVLFFGASAIGIHMYFRKQRKKIERIFDRIELIARKVSPKEKTPEHTERTRPQVDLDALPDAPEAGREDDRRNREHAE